VNRYFFLTRTEDTEIYAVESYFCRGGDLLWSLLENFFKEAKLFAKINYHSFSLKLCIEDRLNPNSEKKEEDINLKDFINEEFGENVFDEEDFYISFVEKVYKFVLDFIKF
jgi:hypothetical protein